MTRNTLAAALMAGVVGVFAGIFYLSTYYPNTMALVLTGCLGAMALACLWDLCQHVAQEIIEARRKRQEGQQE